MNKQKILIDIGLLQNNCIEKITEMQKITNYLVEGLSSKNGSDRTKKRNYVNFRIKKKIFS